MKGGQNRLPRVVKERRGTLEKSREHPQAPRPKAAKVPAPPKGTPRAQKRIWVELAEQVNAIGSYSRSDFSAFKLLVAAIFLVEVGGKDLPAHALVTAMRGASSQLQRFGLDPASRSRVAGAAPPAADEAEEFFGLVAIPGGKAAGE